MNNEPLISQEEMSALLGRPLTPVEISNFSLYLEIAILRLNDLLCLKLEDMAELPADLKLVIARCFSTIVQEQADIASHGITNKKIEDYSVSFDADADSPMVAFVDQNLSTLKAYSKCQGSMRSGGCPPCLPCCLMERNR